MAEQSKSKDDRVAQLEKDVALWRENYEKSENNLRKAVGEIAQLTSELRHARAELEPALSLAAKSIGERDKIQSLLLLLLDHTAGRTGGLGASHLFCGVCENPNICPTKQIREYLRELDDVKEATEPEVVQP